MWRLPREILALIFSHLKKRDVLHCALVCSTWKRIAMPIAYETVILNGEHVDLVKKLLGFGPLERDRHFQYGKFTNWLMIEREYDDVYFNKEELILLLEYLPNLEVLDLGDSNNYVSYIKYINETESNKSLLKIKSFITERLEDDFAFNNLYFATCYKYRATIIDLDLQFENLFFNISSISGDIITLLAHFNRLTDLTFTNTCSAELTTLDLQEACPHLVSLTYDSDFHIPDSTVKNVLDKTNHGELDYKDLKEFDITVPSIQKNYADYIAKYVSPHVEILRLQISNLDLYDWMDSIGYYNALSLLNSLCSVEKHVHISWSPDKDYIRQSSDSRSDMTNFFSCLNAFKGDDRVYCSCRFSDRQEGYKSIQHTSNHDLYFNYGLNHSDIYSTSDTDSSFRSTEVVLPDYSKSTIGPKIINNMEVNISMLDDHADLLLKFAQYALTNCPNLEYFLYKSMGYPKGDICICPDIYIDTFRRKRENRVLNTTQENLKVVKTRNIIPSTEMLRLLNNYVPAMETLVCGYDSPYDAPRVDVTLLDLTESGNLSLVIIDIQFLCVDSPDVCYIEMEYSSKDLSYYLLEMNENGLSLNSVTTENIEEQSNKDGAIILSILIKCHIHVHFKFYCEYTRVADIINGELIQKNEVSYDSFTLFKL